MVAYLESIGLEGFANFFKIQVQEERYHAMKFFDYVNERGGRVILEAIDRPQVEFNSPVEIFEIAYKHEQYVTKCRNPLDMFVNGYPMSKVEGKQSPYLNDYGEAVTTIEPAVFDEAGGVIEVITPTIIVAS